MGDGVSRDCGCGACVAKGMTSQDCIDHLSSLAKDPDLPKTAKAAIWALATIKHGRDAAAYAYQLAGGVGAGIAALDNLSAVSHGDPPPHDWPVASSGDITEMLATIGRQSERIAELKRQLTQALEGIADITKTAVGEAPAPFAGSSVSRNRKSQMEIITSEAGE